MGLGLGTAQTGQVAAPDLISSASSPRDVVRIVGPDAAAYLQSQLSQNVERLAVGDAARSLLLQPDGKVVGWFRVVRLTEDGFLLLADAGAGAAIVTRLERFKLRMRLDLTDERWRCTTTIGGDVPGAPTVANDEVVLPLDWPGCRGTERFVLADPAPVHPPDDARGDEAIEWARILAGVPRAGVDYGIDGTTIPGELGEWALHAAADFEKGCYTGQELVARIDSRGNKVPKPLRVLHLDRSDVPPVDATVLVDGAEAGRITSRARTPEGRVVALAIVARRVAVPADVTVDWDDHQSSARAEPLPHGR